jgi:hypothetical protein
MLNNKPNGAGNYRHGNFIPENKEKVYKLNSEGGLYYRSSWELTAMKYFDMNENIVLWGAECIEIPYEMKKPDKYGIVKLSRHRYYPDFYYKLKLEDGTIKEILLEVKPEEQTKPPEFKETSKMNKKQLESYEWGINEYNRNMSKWEAVINYCETRGIEFKILVKREVDRMIKNYINKF